MESLWHGIICNCMYSNEEDNEVIDNLEDVKILY